MTELTFDFSELTILDLGCLLHAMLTNNLMLLAEIADQYSGEVFGQLPATELTDACQRLTTALQRHLAGEHDQTTARLLRQVFPHGVEL